MAKAKKKSAKEASNTFHNIMAASVNGNPKPVESTKLPQDILKHIQEEIAIVLPDWGEYVVLQIRLSKPHQIFYNIDDTCPEEEYQKIEKIILHNAELLDLPVVTEIE